LPQFQLLVPEKLLFKASSCSARFCLISSKDKRGVLLDEEAEDPGSVCLATAAVRTFLILKGREQNQPFHKIRLEKTQVFEKKPKETPKIAWIPYLTTSNFLRELGRSNQKRRKITLPKKEVTCI
jgi:hypothetical protein